LAAVNFNRCAQYITIILLSFIIISSWVLSGQSTSVKAAASSSSHSTKTNLTNTTTEAGQQKKVSVSGNNMYVVWTDNTDINTNLPGKNFEILFRKSTDGGKTFGITKDLSNNRGNSLGPQIAISGNNMYVVWMDNTRQDANLPGKNNEILFRKSTDGGKTFGSTINLSNNIGFATDQQIAVSGSNVYVTWNANYEIFFRKSTDGGNTFGSFINLSHNPGFSYVPNIALAGSTVYVTWGDETPGSFDILLRKSTDGGNTFGSTINLSNNTGFSYGAKVALAGSTVYVIWGDNTPGNDEIFFRKSTDGGNTFGSTINVSNNTANSLNPQIALAGSTLYVTWQDNTPGNYEIFLKISPDGGSTFSTALNLSHNPGVSYLSSVPLAVAGTGTGGSSVYVAWLEFNSTTGKSDIFLHSSTVGLNGSVFNSITRLSHNSGGVAPQVTVAGSNVYVIWEDNTFASEYDIFLNNVASNNGPQNLSHNAGFSGGPQIAVS
jgi:hypothetical protein